MIMQMNELFDKYSSMYSKRTLELMKKHKANNLTIHQLEYLNIINILGKVKLMVIAKELDITNSSASVMIQKLQVLNLVQKTASNSDKRASYISITDQAREIIELDKTVFLSIWRDMELKLNEQDKKSISTILEKLV